MKKVIGIGNALIDILVKVENEQILDELALPKGSMQLIDTERYHAITARIADRHKERATGGSACNTMLALAHLGNEPAIVGKISDDENGRFFADNCREFGITPFLQHSELPSGVALTFITPDGERTFGTYLGAAALLTPEDIDLSAFEGYDYLYIEGYLVQNHALIERCIEVAHKRGMKVCLDLASYNIVAADRDFFAKLLESTDFVFANEEEAKAFTGMEPEEALAELAKICPTAIVKVGAHGAMAQRGTERAHVPALPIDKVVDTTAAGDFFAAGFLHAEMKGAPLSDCLTLGNRLAAAVIQVVGTRLSKEVIKELREEK